MSKNARIPIPKVPQSLFFLFIFVLNLFWWWKLQRLFVCIVVKFVFAYLRSEFQILWLIHGLCLKIFSHIVASSYRIKSWSQTYNLGPTLAFYLIIKYIKMYLIHMYMYIFKFYIHIIKSWHVVSAPNSTTTNQIRVQKLYFFSAT